MPVLGIASGLREGPAEPLEVELVGTERPVVDEREPNPQRKRKREERRDTQGNPISHPPSSKNGPRGSPGGRVRDSNLVQATPSRPCRPACSASPLRECR